MKTTTSRIQDGEKQHERRRTLKNLQQLDPNLPMAVITMVDHEEIGWGNL